MATTKGKLIPLLELEELELEEELLEEELEELLEELEDELLVRPELELELLDDELLEDELDEDELLEEAVSTGPLQAQAKSDKRIGTPQRVSIWVLIAIVNPPYSVLFSKTDYK